MIDPHRATGCLLGLAVGDCVGAAVEFKAPGTFAVITDMLGGGPFQLLPGQYTDDTAMALCLAESLIRKRGFDAHDQMQTYVRWYREGHQSSNGKCFDIGQTTAAALERFSGNGQAYAGSSHPRQAGNGSLMRLAPIPLAFHEQPEKAVTCAALMSKTTHATPACVEACRITAEIIRQFLHGEIPDLEQREFFKKHHYHQKPAGSGYVVDSLASALWSLRSTTSFRDCILAAANLGNDADTTAAIAGQMAGARYGESSIPENWLKKLCRKDEIRHYSLQLLRLA